MIADANIVETMVSDETIGLGPYGIKNLDQLTQKQSEFIGAVIQHGTIAKACRETGQAKSTHYSAMAHNQAYAEAFATARKIYGIRIVDDLAEDCLEGFRSYKFTKDGSPILFPPGHELEGQPYFEISKPLVGQIFMAKTLGGLVETKHVQHSGSVDSKVSIQVMMPAPAACADRVVETTASIPPAIPHSAALD